MEHAKDYKAIPADLIQGLGVVKDDSAKTEKEQLEEVPDIKILKPGTRESSLAERFNLGGSRGADNATGKTAGMQLLGMLKGDAPGGGDAEPSASNGPLSNLFPREFADSHQGNAHGSKGGASYDQGQSWGNDQW